MRNSRCSGILMLCVIVVAFSSCDTGGGGSGSAIDAYLDRIPTIAIDLTPADNPATSIAAANASLDVDGSTDDLYADLADGLEESEIIGDVVDVYIPIAQLFLDHFKTYVQAQRPAADTVFTDGSVETLFGIDHLFDKGRYSIDDDGLQFYYTVTVDSVGDYYFAGSVRESGTGSDTYTTTVVFDPADGLDLVYIEYDENTGNVVGYEEYDEEYEGTDPAEPAIAYNYRLYEIEEEVDADTIYADYREMHLEEPAASSAWSDNETEDYWYVAVSSRADGIEVYEEDDDIGGSDNVYAKVNASNTGVSASGPLSSASDAFQGLLSDWDTTARAAIDSFQARTLIPPPSDPIWTGM